MFQIPGDGQEPWGSGLLEGVLPCPSLVDFERAAHGICRPPGHPQVWPSLQGGSRPNYKYTISINLMLTNGRERVLVPTTTVHNIKTPDAK